MTVRPVGSATVAVVITTFDHAHFLDDAISSVLDQSATVDEIIVVDDGSTDHPERVTARYPNVRTIHQRNLGLASARNTGWRASTSDFVVFLDADDRLKCSAVETNSAHLLAHPEAAFSYGAYVQVWTDADVSGAPIFRAADDGFADFLRGNPIGMHATVMYRRSVLATVCGFTDGLPACEDYDMYLRIARGHTIVHGGEVLAEYRQHGANMSRDSAMMLKAALRVLRRHEKEARRRGLLPAYREGVARWKRFYVRQWLREAAPAVRSRHFDIVLARQGLALAWMAPITTSRLSLDRAASRLERRTGRRSRD